MFFFIISSAVLNQCDSNARVRADSIMTGVLLHARKDMWGLTQFKLARCLLRVLLVPVPQQTPPPPRLVSNLPMGGKTYVFFLGLRTTACSRAIDHEISTLDLSMHDNSCNHIIFFPTSPTTKCLSDCLLHCLSHLTDLSAIKERV